jgi:hypothetical protein
MERQAIELRFHGRDHCRVAMTECEDAKPSETIQELAPVDVADKAAFTLPFHHGPIDGARFRPAIEIAVKAVHALSDEVFLVGRREVRIPQFHRSIVLARCNGFGSWLNGRQPNRMIA